MPIGLTGSRDRILGPFPCCNGGGAQPSRAIQGFPVLILWKRRGEQQQEKPLKLLPLEQLTAFPYSTPLQWLRH